MTAEREAAARLTTASWWPGDKPGAVWSAKGELTPDMLKCGPVVWVPPAPAPYQPGLLAWVLTVLAAAVMGAAGVVWLPL